MDWNLRVINMSWYYNYYIGKEINGKIEIIGMYDNEGRVYPVIERSRSFASPLKNRFCKYIGDDLKELEEELHGYISVCSYRDLPSGDYIKTGYFLIEDVTQYLKEHDTWGLFYDKMSPEVYAEKLKIEQTFGPPKPKKNEEGYEYEIPSCADYMYFAYPDYSCEEYEASIIKYAVEILQPIEKDDIVIVLSEG